MESTLRILQDSPYSWTFLSIVAIAGFILAIYGIRKEYQQITYCRKTYKITNLLMYSYAGSSSSGNRKNEDFIVTKIAIWNSGNKVINSTDIAYNEPLRICIGNNLYSTKIYKSSIEYVTDKSNFGKKGLKNIKWNGNTLAIPIDFMAPNDGIILKFIHTGATDNIFVDCHIKGGQKVFEVNGEGFRIKKKTSGLKSAFLFVFKWLIKILIGFAILCYFFGLSMEYSWPRYIHYLYISFILFLIINGKYIFSVLFINTKVPRKIKEQLDYIPETEVLSKL